MIKRVACRYLYAKSISDLLSNTSTKVIDRARDLSVVDNGDGSFRVSGGKGVHTVKTSRKGSDIKVSCSCNAWVFQGSEYYAHNRDYLLGKPRGNLAPPKIRDPKGINAVCKHVVAVFDVLNKRTFKFGKRVDLLQQLPICDNPEEWAPIVNALETEKKLDFTTQEEMKIFKVLTKDTRYREFILKTDLFKRARRRKIAPALPFVTATEHATVRMALRNTDMITIKKGLESYFKGFSETQKINFVEDMNTKQVHKCKVGVWTIILKPNIISGVMKDFQLNLRNKGGCFFYHPSSGVIVMNKGVHFRIHTAYSNKKPFTVGKPFGVENAPLVCRDAVPSKYHTTHTDLKFNEDYDWSARFGTMVKTVTERWLTDNTPITSKP